MRSLSDLVVVILWRCVVNVLSVSRGGCSSHIIIQPTCNLPASTRSLPSCRTSVTSIEGIIDLNEVLEVMSPQVSLEMMGPMGVQDLPGYHSLIEDFEGFTTRWMAAGHLRGLASVGDGYLLELVIHLSGEEGNVLLGQLDREGSSNEELPPSYRG